eukprot:GHVU01061966.1.p1 GENE.GHVU01061966.1~~GHVU01061966.1.p1  ORF type:complete len:139 (+),score=18.30 GHVU01061966.1:584-1000(+)
MMFWKLVNTKCGRGDKNILAAGAQVPVDIYSIDEVVVDGSQLGLMLIKAIYGRPSPNQLQGAIVVFTRLQQQESTRRNPMSQEEQNVMQGIQRAISTLETLTCAVKVVEFCRTINNELKAKANEAIACLTGTSSIYAA